MKSPGSLSLLLVLALAGCANEPAPAAANPFATLQKNMSADQVTALLGEPLEIKAIKPARTLGITGEIWVYRRKVSETVQPRPIGTRELPATNPLTGQPITIAETIYENQSEVVYETIELLLVGQRVIEWKSRRSVEREFR